MIDWDIALPVIAAIVVMTPVLGMFLFCTGVIRKRK